MLGGRSARIVITSETPKWFLSLFYRYGMIHQMRGQILAFVGIKPAPMTYFSGTSRPKTGMVDKWVKKIEAIDAAGA